MSLLPLTAGPDLAQAVATVRRGVRDTMPAGRAEFLRRYRVYRQQGLSPYSSILTIRGIAAATWIRAPVYPSDTDLLDLAVAAAADEYMTSRWPMSGYWWRP